MKDFRTIYGRNRQLNSGLFNVQVNLQLPTKGWRNLLRKLKTFSQYCATVGVHASDAKKKIIRRYQKTNSKGKLINRRAGVTHRLTIGKLAHQTEYGAQILIKEKFTIAKKMISRKTSKTYWWHTGDVSSVTHTTKWGRYSKRMPTNRQGYVLVDKAGKFVWYKRPGSVITIPARPFLRPIINEPEQFLTSTINRILKNTFVNNGYTATKAWRLIAKFVEERAKSNIRNSSPNHPSTVKAKWSNKPLTDEQDRLYKSIKFKIYKGVTDKNSKGYGQLAKQFERKVDKLLQSASHYQRMSSLDMMGSITTTTKTRYFGIPSIGLSGVPKI